MNPFIFEICEYIADKTTFTLGSDLYVGELPRDIEGVYAIALPGEQPDMYTAVEYYDIDFNVRYKKSTDAFTKIKIIYDLLHRLHDYPTDNFYVYFSHASSSIRDLDRDFEGNKVLSLGVRFICRNTNYIS